MNPDRLRLELRAINVSLAAGLRTVQPDDAHGARLRALTLLDRVEAKLQQARTDPSQPLAELDAVSGEVAAAKLAIEGIEPGGSAIPSTAPVDPD